MKSLKRDLFERRLWPLAVVIVVAIVAVPFVLHGHRANADIATPPASNGTSSAPAPSTHHSHAPARHPRTPTSHTRDPFEAASADVSAASSTSTTGPAPTRSNTTSVSESPTPTSTPAVGSSGGAASGSPSSETSTPAAGAPTTSTSEATTPNPVTTSPGERSGGGVAKVRRWDIYSVDLRIGAPGSPVVHRDIARLTPLPRERSPQVMYMGVVGHGRAAVFALGAGVEVRPIGGRRSAGVFCHPTRVNCALAVVPAGRSVAVLYVSSTGASRTVVLRVTRIRARVTQSESVLKAARGHVSAVGLCDLKLGDPIGFFDLSDDSVTLPTTGSCRHRKLAVPFPGSLGAGSSVRG